MGQALNELFASDPGANFGLLFSLTHDFPVEWSAFVNGAANFTATIPRDFFPYFTQGKALTITAIEIYGTDLKHHVVGNPGAATNDLADKNKLAFTVNIPRDTAGPAPVLTRSADKEYS